MNREDIIRMAREAGLYHFYDSEGDLTGITDAKPIDEDKNRNDDRLVEILARFAALVRADEREACAKVCEQIDTAAFGSNRPEANDCAAAIRARGQA